MQKSQNKKQILIKKNDAGETSYVAATIKTVQNRLQDRQINQWSRIKSPKIDPQRYSINLSKVTCQDNLMMLEKMDISWEKK